MIIWCMDKQVELVKARLDKQVELVKARLAGRCTFLTASSGKTYLWVELYQLLIRGIGEEIPEFLDFKDSIEKHATTHHHIFINSQFFLVIV